MRRLLFLSGIGFFFILLSYLSFFAYTKEVEDRAISDLNFSQEDVLFAKDSSDEKAPWKKVETVTDASDLYFYKKLSPFDGVYFTSSDPEPLEFREERDTVVLSIKTGTYLFNFTDLFQKYEIVSDSFSIKELGKGIFLVHNEGSVIKVYPISSILSISLLENNNPVTTFTLFPSLLFQYSPSYNNELKNADIIRIATIDSIRYTDIKGTEGLKKILDAGNSNAAKFVQHSMQDVQMKMAQYNTAYQIISQRKNTRATISELAEHYPFLFLNDTKKESFLKERLSLALIALIGEDQYGDALKHHEKNILSILDEMKWDAELYGEWIELLKNYYYLSYFSWLLETRKNFDPSMENVFVKLFRSLLPSNTSFGSYGYLSDAFLMYQFSDAPPKALSEHIDAYLANILSKRTITKNDFLPFSYFLSEYLANVQIEPDTHLLSIAWHLFTTTNEYFALLDTEEKKKNAMPIIFYNYNRVFSGLNTSFFSHFFQESSNGLVLKPEHIRADGNPNFSPDFFTIFKSINARLKKELDTKWKTYTLQDSSSRVIRDSYRVLQSTQAQTDKIVTTLTNYGEYLNNLKLNDESRELSGILLSQNKKLSREAASEYLQQFNGIDISSLKITNNFVRDGFYDISLRIRGQNFTFKLNPEWHLVYDLVILNGTSENLQFKNLSILFDEKEKEWQDLYNSTSDAAKRLAYDFKNIFLTVYLGEGSETVTPVSSGDSENTEPIMSPEMQLFVQKELLEKDFKNIAHFLPIRFQNIYADIEKGEYRIDLMDIQKTLQWNRSYQASISGKYTFTRHAFYKLTIRIFDEGGKPLFSGLPIEIAPSRIALTAIEDILQEMPRYIESLPAITGSEKLIVFDFTAGVISIDGQKFTPKP